MARLAERRNAFRGAHTKPSLKLKGRALQEQGHDNLETMQGLQGTKIALLIDFDNVILGVEDPGFDVELVVNALRSRGVVVMGRAYGDWYRHHRHRRKLMEQGIELVETPVFGPLIKNSADIRIVIDGLDIATAHEHIDTFCLVSGDSDFLPLIKRLQLLGKHVIVIAGVKFTSDLVRRNCNEYLAYENLLAESVGATEDASTLEGSFHLLERAINTLTERGMDIRSSTVKQMMLQLNPAFSERTFGCYQFKQFLDKAARAGVVQVAERAGLSGEHDVLLSERSGQTSLREASARLSHHESSTGTKAPDAPRDLNGQSNGTEKRPTSRGGRGRNRTSSSAEKLVAPTSETTAESPIETKTDSQNAPEAPVFGVVAPISANALASRPGLRRGRLRFSAKSGGASVAPEVSTTQNASESESSTRLTEEMTDAAPVEQTLDLVQTPQEVLPDESVLAATVADASLDSTSDAPISDEANQADESAATDATTTKRRGSRGGKRRRGAKNGEVAAENATETAPENAENVAEVSTLQTENVAPTLVKTAAPEVETTNAETPNDEAVAPKKRATRARRGTKKTAAVAETPEVASE